MSDPELAQQLTWAIDELIEYRINWAATEAGGDIDEDGEALIAKGRKKVTGLLLELLTRGRK